MSYNKRVPRCVQSYLVIHTWKNKAGGRVDTYQYFHRQEQARAWAAAKVKLGEPGRFRLFKINYDFYELLEDRRKRPKKARL